MLERLRVIAEAKGLELLPEIHATYAEQTYAELSRRGYMTYDFFLPGLLLDALETGSGALLCRWAQELIDKRIHVVNMLGCHDGIPLLDLRGLVPDERIDSLIHTVVDRGGYVKNLYGQKNAYYQVNATYFSALGESEKRLLLCRAVQLFMPGIPQIWYLDLFAGRNDRDAVARAGAGGHKEINRTNLSHERVEAGLKLDVVKSQLELLRFRNTFPAFGFDARLTLAQPDQHTLVFLWEKDGFGAQLEVNLHTSACRISKIEPDGTREIVFQQDAEQPRI